MYRWLSDSQYLPKTSETFIAWTPLTVVNNVVNKSNIYSSAIFLNKLKTLWYFNDILVARFDKILYLHI